MIQDYLFVLYNTYQILYYTEYIQNTSFTLKFKKPYNRAFLAPLSGHWTNHSQLSYLIKTQYYISLSKREQIINFGKKPKILPLSRRYWARDIRRLKSYDEGLFALDEARRYQEYLERKDVNTKAEIAEIFGVSRARVTQYLNLLKLPKRIIKFLDNNRENIKVKKYFTERRLRPLTWMDKKVQCIEKFNEILRASD